MTREERRDIALDYWGFIALAVSLLVAGSGMNNWENPGMGSYFIATWCIIHAHGNRNRATLLALHTKDPQ